MTKFILITGGAGFIGSNFVPYFCAKYADYHCINLDKLTYAGNLDNLKECDKAANYTFVQGDICDRELIESLFAQYDIRGVIHFAAESHVDNSISGPQAFIETNVVGTFTLIDVARASWMKAPHKVKSGFEDCRFHHISTDEVYGTLGATGLFTESTPYAPNSPYSASKASSDMIVRSYFHTYGMNVTTSNCSNNYGPKQHAEKLIPKIISNCLEGKPIPIYGDGKNVRDWLYVMDHCKAIDLVYHEGRAGEVYNIGGRNEKNNLEIVAAVCSILDAKVPRNEGSYSDLVRFVTDRAGHDRRYAIDATKLEKELDWNADENFASGIVKTVEWYLAQRYI
ncbi:MAG: dTDP-glucose 4,6-dehydratase [Pseudomonadota bacterium]